MKSLRAVTLGLLAAVVGAAACSSSAGSDGASGGSGTGGSGTGGEGGGPPPFGGSGNTATPGDDLSGPGVDHSGLGRSGFRFGINLGHPNPDFSDAVMSDLAADVGVTSIRIKYPDYHFFNWGTGIEVGDAEHYAENGQG